MCIFFVIASTLTVVSGLIFFIISMFNVNRMSRWWLPLYLMWPVSLVAVYIYISISNVLNKLRRTCWEHEWKETGREGYWIQKTCTKCDKKISENMNYRDRDRGRDSGTW